MSINSKILILLILSFQLLIVNCVAQVTQEWVARYNGPGNSTDYAYSIAVDYSGNVYVTGRTLIYGADYDYATIKYNSSGIQQWVQRFNGPLNYWDEAYSIAVNASGDVYVTGRSVGSSSLEDYVTIKYNSLGTQMWLQRYNGPGNYVDVANSIVVDSSGNIYVTGYSRGSGTNDDYATIKYNSSGVQQWLQRYNGPANGPDYAFSIAVDDSANVYVTGRSMGTGTYDDYATIKYNSSGTQQWVQIYNGQGNSSDWANSIFVDDYGNVYVTGYSGQNGYFDYATVKYNSSGIQQWVQTYNGPGNGNDRAYSLVADAAGNVYVTGGSIGTGTYEDYATIKYNSAGVQQWVRQYNGPGNDNDRASSIVLDGSGNVYITGYSYGDATNRDYLTIKYNSMGDQRWIQRYNGPGNGDDRANSIYISSSGNVYVSGYSAGNGTDYDYATIKYSQLIGIQLLPGDIPESFSLSQNYPNPFNPTTHLRFDLPAEASAQAGISDLRFVSLKVYDLMGREVQTLVNEALSPGTYEVEFDGSNFSSGVYYYTLSSRNYFETKRMALIK